MEKIELVLRSIELMKTMIIKIDTDPYLPYLVKTQKLTDMRQCLIRTQAMVVVMMQDHLDNMEDAA